MTPSENASEPDKAQPRLASSLQSTRGAMSASVLSLALRITGLGSALAFQLSLFHYAGATAFGEFSYYTAWILTLAALARFGFDTLAMRLTPQFLQQGDTRLLHGLLQFSLVCVFGLGLLAGFAFLWATSGWLETEPSLAWTVRLTAAGAIVLVSINLVMEAVLRSHGHVTLGSLATLVSSLACIAILLIANGSGVKIDASAAIMLFAAGHLIAFFPLAISVLCIWPATVPEFQRRAWTRIVIPLAFSGAIGIAQGQCGIICCGLLANAEEAGRFAFAIRFAAILLVGQQAINAVLAPRFSACHVRGNQRDLQHLAALAAWGTLSVAIIGAVTFALLGYYAAPFLPSIDRITVQLTLVMMTGTLVAALAGSAGYLLTMTGHHRPALTVLVGSLLLNLGLNATLTPKYGAWGSATAQVTATLVMNAILFFLVRRYLGIRSTIGLISREPVLSQMSHSPVREQVDKRLAA